MRKLSMTLLAGLILSLPATSADKPGSKKDAERKIATAGAISGEVVTVNTSQQSLTIKVTYSYTTVNQGALRAIQTAKVNYARAASRRDVNGMRSAQRSLVDNQRRLYDVKKESKDIPIETVEGFKVRLKQPKAAFTEMGDIKEFTKKELAEMRGKDRLFDGEWSDVRKGQYVHITLVRQRRQPRPKNPDDLKLMTNTAKTSRIVILTDPPQ